VAALPWRGLLQPLPVLPQQPELEQPHALQQLLSIPLPVQQQPPPSQLQLVLFSWS